MKKLLSVLVALMMLCAVPALIALGVTVFDDRKYYLISLLIIACTLVPFAVYRLLLAPFIWYFMVH